MTPTMLDYEFMRTAFLAGGIVAAVAAAVGFFLVLRHSTFAGHALAHVGFAGATGAILIGVGALWGLIAFTLAAGVAMGLLGERLRGRDVAIGMVLALALGFGVFFLHFYTAGAAQATAILFGNILGIDPATLWSLFALSVVSLAALAAIARPLLFATLAPDLAEAKGVSLRLVSVLFLAIAAIAVAEAAQAVGVLLAFALTVGPAAAALQLTARLGRGIALAVLFAVAETWGGIAAAYYTDWPTSFCIVALSGLVYLVSIFARPTQALRSRLTTAPRLGDNAGTVGGAGRHGSG